MCVNIEQLTGRLEAVIPNDDTGRLKAASGLKSFQEVLPNILGDNRQTSMSLVDRIPLM